MPRKEISHHPHEIILDLKPDAKPHFIAHLTDTEPALEPYTHDFGIEELDKFINSQLPHAHINRIYIPQLEIDKSRAIEPIGENYTKEEHEIGIDHSYLISFEDHHLPLNILLGKLKKLPMVKDARLNYEVETYHMKKPSKESYIKSGLWGLEAVNCRKAWEIEKGLSDITIAVIDTGLDLNQEAFKGRISSWQYDFVHKTTHLPDPFRFQLIGDYHTPDPDPTDYSGHGTHCTGIAAGAATKNGFSGVCPNATILPLRVFYSYQDVVTRKVTDKATEVDVSAAIHYAVNAGADIISMSFGGSKAMYESALTYAEKHNVALFGACGNQGYTLATFPACDPRVLAVGGINKRGRKVSTSNHGKHYMPYLMAPGEDVLCPHFENTYYHLTGTSISTPFVAGAAGLILSLVKRKGKKLEVKELYDILLKTAKSPFHRSKGDKYYGDGTLDIAAALKETQKRLGI